MQFDDYWLLRKVLIYSFCRIFAEILPRDRRTEVRRELLSVLAIFPIPGIPALLPVQ